MPEYKLSFILEAENKARAAIEQVKEQLEGVEKKIKNMEPAFKKMAAVGAAGFAAITGAVALSVKSAAEAEKVWTMVGHSIKAAGLNVEETTATLRRWATAVQMSTGFSDEYVGQLAGRFLPVTKNVQEAMKLTAIALDLEAKGIANAETATRALLAAREGDIMLLKRYLPQLRGLDDEVLKNMSSAQKYAFVLDLLEKQFGGAAEAAGSTFQGRLNILRETINDLREAIGAAFLPALSRIVKAITPIIEKIAEWARNNPQLIMQITLIVGAIFGLLTVMGTLGMILPNIIAGFSMLAPILLPLGIIIGGIIAVMQALGIGINDIIPILENWIGKIKDTVSPAIEAFWGIIKEKIIPALRQWWSDLQIMLIPILERLWSTFQNQIIPTARILWDIFWNFVRPAFERLWNTIANQVWPSLQRLWEVIATKLMPALAPLVEIVGAALFGAFTALTRILVELLNIGGKVFSWIVDFVAWILGKALDAIQWLTDKFFALVNALVKVYEWGKKAAESVSKIGTGIKEKVTGFFGGKQFGGEIPRTGMYMLHRGERVVPAGATVGGGIVVNINGGFYLSERAAEEMGNLIIRKLKKTIKL